MMKYFFLLLACLAGSTMAAGGEITTETQLYIVAGILGGACLLLTIASIYNSVTIINLQSKVAVLQAACNATVKAVASVAENSPRMPKDPYVSRDDHYRRQEPRGGYRMERMNPHYDDHRSNRSHGMQPSRPYQDDRRPPAGYY